MHETIEVFNKAELIAAFQRVAETVRVSYEIKLGKTRYNFKPVNMQAELKYHTDYIEDMNERNKYRKNYKVCTVLTMEELENEIRLKRLKRFKKIINGIKRTRASIYNEL